MNLMQKIAEMRSQLAQIDDAIKAFELLVVSRNGARRQMAKAAKKGARRPKSPS